MWSHANLGPRDVWGARTGTCKSAFAEFSIGVQAQRHPVFVPDRRAGCVHSFFWYWKYGRTESLSKYSPFLQLYVQGPVQLMNSVPVMTNEVMSINNSTNEPYYDRELFDRANCILMLRIPRRDDRPEWQLASDNERDGRRR